MRARPLLVDKNLTILERIIVDIVNRKQGCKLMELIVEITNIVINNKQADIDMNDTEGFLDLCNFESLSTSAKVNLLLDTVIKLISNNKLIGLHYKLNIGNYHEKMFILPKGSSFKYLSKKEKEKYNE
jgi:hypothetical protein